MCQFLPGVPFERHILRNCLHSWNLFQLWRHSPLPFNQAGFKFVNLFSYRLQLEPIYQILHTMFLASHPVRLIFAPHNRPPGALQETFELHKAPPGSIYNKLSIYFAVGDTHDNVMLLTKVYSFEYALMSLITFQLQTDYHLLLINLVLTDLCISIVGIPFNTITSWRSVYFIE